MSLRVCLNLSKFLLIYRRRVTFVLTQGSCKDKMKKRKKKDAEVIYAIHRRVPPQCPWHLWEGMASFDWGHPRVLEAQPLKRSGKKG